MATETEAIEQQLRAALPPSLAVHAATLARLLDEAAQGHLSPEAAQAQLEANPQLRAAVRALAGRELVDGGPLIRFGEGSQLGDIAIGDVAGGDIVKLQVAVQAGPGRRERLLTALLQALVVVVVGSAAGLLIWSRLSAPGRMGGIFNVAIAEFGTLGTNGVTQPWPEGRELSRSLSVRLAQELTALPALEGKVEVRQEGIGRVEGRSRIERAARAASLAEGIGADVLIYGNLDPTSDGTFVPEFYIREGLLPQAEELTGEGQLGAPMKVQSGLGGELELSENLETRLRALTRFTLGLARLVVKQPAEAAELFEQITQLDGWERSEGQEVVYLFLGSANYALFEASADQAYLERAEAAYSEAATLNPAYARAYIGVGNVAYERFVASDQRDLSQLDAALAAYEQALIAPEKPTGAKVAEKVLIALGNAYVSRAQHGHPEDFARAETRYRQVSAAFEAGQSDLSELAAFAYCGLGVVAERGRRDWDEAYTLYGQCREHAGDNERLSALAEAQLTALEPRLNTPEPTP